jgi:glutathione S-transferase
MLTIWGRRSAFNVQKVLWFVGELGLAHEHIPAGGGFGINDTDSFLAMNPHGRVPVIKDEDGTIVWESHAILRYLAARHGRPRYWDEDPARRSQAERWMDWSQASLQPAFLTGVFWNFYRTPEAQRNWKLIRENLDLCGRYFRLLDDVLRTRPFLAGDEFTLADIPAGTCLYRYFELDIERIANERIANERIAGEPLEIPRVESWYARLRQRPAYRQHVMIHFEDLYWRLEY